MGLPAIPELPIRAEKFCFANRNAKMDVKIHLK